MHVCPVHCYRRDLASLCLVSEGSLGHKLAAVLSRMAQQEFAAQSEGDVGGIAAQVLAEIVVPSILEAADQVINFNKKKNSRASPSA